MHAYTHQSHSKFKCFLEVHYIYSVSNSPSSFVDVIVRKYCHSQKQNIQQIQIQISWAR